MSATLTGKWGDDTFGQFRLGFAQGGTKMELVNIEFSNDVSASNVIPSTLTKLLGVVGHVCATLNCVSGTMGKPITNFSLCEGPVLEISVGDTSAGASTNKRLVYIAWGW